MGATVYPAPGFVILIDEIVCPDPTIEIAVAVSPDHMGLLTDTKGETI